MISRRSLFSTIAGFAASLAGIGSAAAAWDWRELVRAANIDYDVLPLEPVMCVAGKSVSIRMASGADSFKSLQAWVDTLPRQKTGSPTAICAQTGEKYVELFVRALFRPGDEKVIERQLASQMQQHICSQFTDRRDGTIYWRIPLEWETRTAPQVIDVRDDGPDIDFVTNLRCVMDHNWLCMKVYCLMTVSPDPA